MTNKLKTIALSVACVFLAVGAVALPADAIAQQKHDGYMWRDSMQESNRIGYVIGFLDAAEVMAMSIPIAVCVKMDYSKDCMDKAFPAASDDIKKYANIRIGSFVEGVNVFYQDYQNRKVAIPGALNYVSQAIGGASRARLDSMAEEMRAASR